MKRFNLPRSLTLTVASGTMLASVVPLLLASCASTMATSDDSGDASTVLEAAPPLDDGGAPPPVECEQSDEDCVTDEVSCDEAQWCPVPTKVDKLYALTNVWGSGPNDVWATGSGGTVIHWEGTEWTPTVVPSETQPIKDTFRALWGSGPNDVWIAAATDKIFHSTGFRNGTATWERAPSASEADHDRRTLNAVWGTSSTDVRFGGPPNFFYDPAISETVPKNQVVLDASGGTTAWTWAKGLVSIHGFWGPSESELWVIGDNRPYSPPVIATVLRGTRTDAIEFDWTPLDSKAATRLRGIWGSSADDVWIVGDTGTIRHFGANSTEAEIVETRTRSNLNAVWGSGPNDVWVVGDDGTILHFDGQAWSESIAAYPVGQRKPHLYGVWGSGPDDVWIVGNDIALHHPPLSAGGTK